MRIWAKIALSILIVEVFIALLPQLFTPYSPTDIDLARRLNPPSLLHPLGTDPLGRDVLTRLLYAVRYSLAIALLALFIALLIGILIGSLSAISRNIDIVATMVFDTLYAVPSFFLAIVVTTLLGRDTLYIAFVIGISFSPLFFRVCKSVGKEVLVQPYVESAKALGASMSWIALKYLVKETLYTSVSTAIYILIDVIALETSLGLLGLSVAPPTPTIGNIIAEYKEYIFVAPYLLAAPILLVFITIASLNCLAKEVSKKLGIANNY